MSVAYMTHPLIKHKIPMLPKDTTGTNEFRKIVEEIAILMDSARSLRKSRSSWVMRRCPTCPPETFW